MGIVELTETRATINVSSTPQQKNISIGEEWKVDVNDNEIYDLLVRLNSIRENKANITITSISEKALILSDEDEVSQPPTPKVDEIERSKYNTWLYVSIVLIIVVILFWIAYKKSNR